MGVSCDDLAFIFLLSVNAENLVREIKIMLIGYLTSWP